MVEVGRVGLVVKEPAGVPESILGGRPPVASE